MIKLLAALVATAALGACSSSSGGTGTVSSTPGSQSRTITHPAPGASRSSSTGPSPAQFASIVSSSEVSIEQTARKIRSCGYQFQPAAGDLTCPIGRMTYATAVSTLGIKLRGATDPTSREYLGQPPAEVQPILDQTQRALREMKAAEARYIAKCGQHGSAACNRALFNWVGAQDDVESALAAWKPYGA